jgi:uncharacterized protein
MNHYPKALLDPSPPVGVVGKLWIIEPARPRHMPGKGFEGRFKNDDRDHPACGASHDRLAARSVATVQPQSPAFRFDEPLTDDDLDALADDVESAGIEFDWMTGFLTAMATGPDLVPPSEWVRVVFGEDPFIDLDDAQLKVGRLMRWYNEIVSAISGNEETICPAADDHGAIEVFCEGYVSGARKHPRWSDDKEAVALLVPIAILAGQLDPSELRDADGRPIDDVEAQLQHDRDDLDFLLRTLHEHWAPARGQVARKAKTNKVGRNEPCPCGSGKKYKKCCMQ